jgi:hypothetical protein
MIYQFDTDDRNAATAALLVYAIWRSRDVQRFKITPDVWAKVERFTKASAKRARSVPSFLEALKPRLQCGTVHPKWMEAGIKGVVGRKDSFGGTEYIQRADSREFLTGVLADCNEREVVRRLYKETTWIILLCRDRLERERPVESELTAIVDTLEYTEESL